MRHLQCQKCARGATRGYFEIAPGQYGLPASSDGPAERMRIVSGPTKMPMPKNRTVTIGAARQELPLTQYECDLCGDPIVPPATATAITSWRTDQPEPPAWEHEYIELPAPLAHVPEPGRISTTPTPYMVHCPKHGAIFLTEPEYTRQMWDADNGWKCPDCGAGARWDDENYEKQLGLDTEPAGDQ